ncbi:hypothetical protein DCC85_14550 [Paenibacillus sp. CAA11]|uniref:hypothetical protein n=1 Tax=Paenibacillus sp. CAA11 TaxID=1532905 RepID=UPI000D3D843A|nr:hypothetical protein [Paenibacillus sp. CAA11]AWB45323.1 hypothetical protein DCC85_14550 [Paenibacillus sp. CAA11]
MSAKKPSIEETKYTLQELEAEAEALFNVRPEVLQGAFYGAQETEHTVEQAKLKIQQFMKAMVK